MEDEIRAEFLLKGFFVMAEMNIETTRRKCLGCGEMFDSTCVGNRLCPKCKPKKRGHGKKVNGKISHLVNNKYYGFV